ncbi:MAG: S24 family peptidase [Bacteroidales bacterium]|nr:S24 family peptidase [Bacteroidales bacterium]
MNNKFSNIRERILFFAGKEGISVRKFSEKSGFSHSLIHNATQLGSDKLEKILIAYPELNPEWLITGKGSMLREPAPEEEYSVTGKKEVRKNGYLSKKEWIGNPDALQWIPLINPEGVFGFGDDHFMIRDEDVQDIYHIPDFEGADFLIRVKGKDMSPEYSGGDLVACRMVREKRFIQWNKCYVLSTKGQGILIKRIKKGSAEDRLLIVSNQKEYEPFEIPESEVNGMALIIGVLRTE